MNLFDSHAHYNDEKFDGDRETLIKDVYKFGITQIVNAGYSIESSIKALNISKKYEFLYATAGVSPNDIEGIEQDYISRIENIAIDKKVVAIGEIGLDYYWNKENKEEQKKIFKTCNRARFTDCNTF